MKTFRTFINQFLVGLVVVSAASVICQPVKAELFTGQSGNVKAEITFDKPQEYQYKNVRLRIVRAGKTVLDKTLPQESEYDRPIGGLFSEKIPVMDLDGDKEPEIIADFFTGGAHCCTYSLIYRYDRISGQYKQIRHDWGNGAYKLEDLNRDRIPEFNSRDDRFAAAFTAYAASAYPLQIWQYRQGKMTDVTRRYPKLIANHASQLWKDYNDIKRQGDDGKGFLAAYLADQYLLGQGQEGWRRVQQAYTKRDRSQYFVELRKFLREAGYYR
ncbi:hypothetical protein [Nostoc sp. MS1]|uniref:hypothetical protein n=1 Tax=Nostoc sp. MS1 TaxID=2764711 RepID=UPI001CC3AEE6|nr:hypothetical protein [Nostoc sp. MS1]BCL37003.1 hypothetical protein NSMS1_34500 [Nostoc sp. MS1]